MSYGAPYGYGSGYGYGVTGFRGILDRLSVRPDSFWSFARRAAGYYSGPVGRIYRTSDGDEKDIYGRGRLGLVDPNEIAAFAPTGNALWTKLYDQTGAGRHFEQATTTLMPYACRQGVPVTENGVQSAEFVAADARRMAVPGSTGAYNFLHTTGGSLHALSKANDTAAAKRLLANKTATDAAGFELSRTSGESWQTITGRLDVAGVATSGTSASGTFAASAITSLSHSMFLIDSDAAGAGNRLFGWQNNAEIIDDNSSTGSPFVEASIGNMTLGSRPNGALSWDGTITEVAIWDSLIGSGDRGTLWSDASSLWGLA